MAVSEERFNEGMTYDEYKAQMTRNQERFEQFEREAPLSADDIAAFSNLPAPLNVLAIAEDWCGDVINNLPILGRLAKESGKLNLRVFLRDQNPDLMDQYLNEGRFRSIPVFVFFDEKMNELGRLTERPDSVTTLRARKRNEIYASDPRFGSPDAPADQLPEDVRTDLTAALNRMREETKSFYDQEVIRELREIVQAVPARG